MSSFQTYLGDIAKKAQQITSKISTIPTTKTRKQKLSQKDIRILKTLREKAKNIVPANKKIDTSFARLASFGDTFKLSTNNENYQKALALHQLTQAKIVSSQKRVGRSAVNSVYFDEFNASALQGMFMLNYDKLDYKKTRYGTESAHLISKDKILTLLNQASKQNLLKKQGLTDFGINYLKDIFKKYESEIFNYRYSKDGREYFRIGAFDSVLNNILKYEENQLSKEGYVGKADYHSPYLEISDAALYKKKVISDYESKNQTFKNILLYSQKEKQLLDKYSNTLAGLSGVDLSGYNKLITDAKKNLDLFYSNINQYYNRGLENKISSSQSGYASRYSQYFSGVNSGKLYLYTGWKKNADNYAALAEKGYKSAFDQLAKILGVSSEQFEITQKTQKETVKQITDILESQNIGKKKEATATSRRNALDIATAKDKPIYETTTRKPVFTQRPS